MAEASHIVARPWALAYDRNLMGIDPRGAVHISRRLLEEIDGPMRRTGLQGFMAPRSCSRAVQRTDPIRSDSRSASSYFGPSPERRSSSTTTR
jgi:hypothetical protein